MMEISQVRRDHWEVNILISPSTPLMNITQPYGRDDTIVIRCRTIVTDIQEKMKDTPGSEGGTHNLMNFRLLLNNHPVEFQSDSTDNVLCGFFIPDEIYSDSLTKDRFISPMKKVFKVKLQAIRNIQKEFGNPEVPSNTFDVDSFVFE